MYIVVIGMGVLFLVLGRLVNENNAKYVLSGYNTMSEASRKRFPLKEYIRLFRRFHVFLGLSFTLIGLAAISWGTELVAGLVIATYPLLAYLFFFVKSQQIGKDEFMPKTTFKVGVAILGACILLVSALVWVGTRENEVKIQQDTLEISGAYGEKIQLDDIKSVRLVDGLPPMTCKVHGFAIGSLKKGYFETKSGEQVKVIAHKKADQTILLERNDEVDVYLQVEPATSRLIYDELDRRLMEKAPFNLFFFH
jgi:hypothetical protein